MTNPYRDNGAIATTEPVKQRIEVKQVGPITAENTGVAAKAVVVKEKAGQVTFLDKLKGYYHTVILITGALLVFLNEATPLTDALPETARHYVTVVIGAITLLVNALKSNEIWIQKL